MAWPFAEKLPESKCDCVVTLMFLFFFLYLSIGRRAPAQSWQTVIETWLKSGHRDMGKMHSKFHRPQLFCYLEEPKMNVRV